jgi:hypothetical protein
MADFNPFPTAEFVARLTFRQKMSKMLEIPTPPSHIHSVANHHHVRDVSIPPPSGEESFPVVEPPRALASAPAPPPAGVAGTVCTEEIAESDTSRGCPARTGTTTTASRRGSGSGAPAPSAVSRSRSGRRTTAPTRRTAARAA